MSDYVPAFTTRWRRAAAASLSAVVAATSWLAASPQATAAPPAPAPPAPPAASRLPVLWGDHTADAAAMNAAGVNLPTVDPGSLYTIESVIGARSAWALRDQSGKQITGQNVGVALLDTGVTQVPALSGAGHVVDGPDLSMEGNGALSDVDTFGHGTHMAGIIAAADQGADLSNPGAIARLTPAQQLGVAPQSTIEALKLANTDGSTDVSQVIAALNWVTEHQTLPNGTKIRVVNLSYGTDSLQAYQSDPLAAAAENAWKHGLIVVVSAGNEGADAHRLTDPAMDPYVISVGASDGADTVLGWSNPSVASFSSSGTDARHPDLVAPGRSIVSLRDPGSTIDLTHPEGRVAGDTSGALFRGSGTSQAAAVVSGVVALMLQANPKLTPDQVKKMLTATAQPMNASALLAGAGQVNAQAAVQQARASATAPGIMTAVMAASWTQTWPAATGNGSIEAARGGSDLVDADGNALTGEVDVQGNPWDGAAWWKAASSLTSWSGGQWNGATWTGGGWGTDGSGTSCWTSARWSSARWSDANWDSAQWTSARWSSARWSAADWDSARWSATDWG